MHMQDNSDPWKALGSSRSCRRGQSAICDHRGDRRRHRSARGRASENRCGFSRRAVASVCRFGRSCRRLATTGFFCGSNRLAVLEEFMTIKTTAMDADSLSSMLQEAVRLYFEPLSWIGRAAKRIGIEVADGVLPGLIHRSAVEAPAESQPATPEVGVEAYVVRGSEKREGWVSIPGQPSFRGPVVVVDSNVGDFKGYAGVPLQEMQDHIITRLREERLDESTIARVDHALNGVAAESRANLAQRLLKSVWGTKAKGTRGTGFAEGTPEKASEK
jgi:hypothetical protein